MNEVRAWNNVEKRFMTDDSIFINVNGESFDYTDEAMVLNGWIIEQSTGLKDKNGVDIFEGDIVDDNFVGVGSVSYIANCAAFKIIYKRGNLAKWFIDMLEKEQKLIEVIGNIHENPELLT